MAYEEEVEKFKRWFVTPITKLRELPNGDGGFTVLMIALPLYERLTAARRKLDPEFMQFTNNAAAMAKDFGMSEKEARRVWNILRDGFSHEAMGRTGGRTKSDIGWEVSSDYGYAAVPKFNDVCGQMKVCLDIGKFTERVLQAFLQNPEFIDASTSFPLASVYSFDSAGFTNDGRGSGLFLGDRHEEMASEQAMCLLWR